MDGVMTRCPWAERSEIERDYHDREWGTPLHDDRALFEFLVLEGMQAGLSWVTILRKRERYRQVFDGFDPEAIARYDAAKRTALVNDPGIIRNRLKIDAAIANARACLDTREHSGSFADFMWQFVDGQPIVNRWTRFEDLPAQSPESLAMSRSLKRQGFKFVGPTICYAYMQAVGMVNDHLMHCFRYHALDATAAR